MSFSDVEQPGVFSSKQRNEPLQFDCSSRTAMAVITQNFHNPLKKLVFFVAAFEFRKVNNSTSSSFTAASSFAILDSASPNT